MSDTGAASGEAADAALVALARQSLESLLQRVVTNAGDTLSLVIPLPADTAASGVAVRTLTQLADETGFTPGYTSGATSLTLTKTNMPVRGARSAEPDALQLLRQLVEVQAHLVQQQKGVNWGVVIALLSLVAQVVQMILENLPHQ